MADSTNYIEAATKECIRAWCVNNEKDPGKVLPLVCVTHDSVGLDLSGSGLTLEDKQGLYSTISSCLADAAKDTPRRTAFL